MPTVLPQMFSASLADDQAIIRSAFEFTADEAGQWNFTFHVDWGAITFEPGVAASATIERVAFVLPDSDPPPNDHTAAHASAGQLKVARQSVPVSYALGSTFVPDSKRTLLAPGDHTLWICLIVSSIDAGLVGATVTGVRPSGLVSVLPPI